MIRYIAGLLVAAVFAASAHAQGIDASTQAKLDEASRIGREINDHDQSAWHVTDALMAANPNAAKLPIGFVTERISPDQVKTTFLLTEGDRTRVYFTGIAKDGRAVLAENFIDRPDAPLATPEQLAMLKAQRTIMAGLKGQSCGKPLNTVAFPAADEPGAFDVYALASETQNGVVQMGGHLKIRIGADGKPKGEVKRFSNSCIAMPKSKDAVGLVISLPSDIGDLPTEIHVFKSLSHKIPIFVMAGGMLWEVNGDKITLSDKPLPKLN